MKVYDLFPFFNELELLELRLEELDSVVDVFGLVELPVTFTDKPKPLYFRENAARFDRWKHKIRVYTPYAYPSGPHPTVDWFQRAQTFALAADSKSEDLIMLSDVDEIPNRDIIKGFLEAPPDHPVVMEQKLYYHRVDLYDPLPWNGTIVSTRKRLADNTNLQELRHLRNMLPRVENGGWHFSWLGNAAAIKNKLQAVDIERDSNDVMKHPSEDEAFLTSCYEKGVDLFGRKEHTKVRVPVIPGVNQPHEIGPWLEKYPQYGPVDTVPY